MGRRMGVLGAGVVLVLLVACGNDGGRGGETEAAGSSGGPEVEEVVPDQQVGESVVAVGDVLVGLSPFDAEPAVLRSSDLGASWESVPLPEMPEASVLDSVHLHLREDVAVAVADGGGSMEEDSPLYLWASRDGAEWHGGLLTEVGGVGSALATTVLGTGDVLLVGVPDGIPPGSDQVGGFDLFYSVDGGVTWDDAQLPDLGLAPGARIMGMRGLASDHDDGHLRVRLLHAGPAITDATGAGGAGAARADDGAEVEAVSSDDSDDPADRPVEVLESTDGGQAWQAAECPPEALGPAGDCRDITDHDGLSVRGAEVSVDGGDTWQLPAIEPDPDISERESLGFDAVVGNADDGWLATASTTFAGDVGIGLLLQSDDGLNWRHLFSPDPCWEQEDITRPNSYVTDPVELAGDRIVAYSCVSLNDPESAELLVVGEGGDEELIEGTRTDGIRYGQPLVMDDLVVVPAISAAGQVSEFLHLRP